MTERRDHSKSSGNENESARETILARVRSALAPKIAPVAGRSVARGYRRSGSLDREARLDLFVDRLTDYDATILQVESETNLGEAIASLLQSSGENLVVVAAAFPREWLPPGLQLLIDDPATAGGISELERVEAVVTTCEIAVASTGTILLKHVGSQGRRAITLLPDHHICLVRRDQVVELLPEALAVLDPTGAAPITTVAGPSATSDIEMTRIRGVHGPRRLSVILYGPMRG